MFFYFIYFLISSSLFILINLLKFFNKKIYQHIDSYSYSFKNVLNALDKIDRTKTDILLFHAASAGEFEQLKPILSKINRKKYYIVQSFTSPTIFNKEYDNDLFVTLNLSSPNDLLPIIGLLGFVLISVTGAKLI